MEHGAPQGWEPDSQKMGNWRAMFESDRRAAPAAEAPSAREAPAALEEAVFDPLGYRPWVLQRGRSHPAMMLEFRRFEPRSGLWSGWAVAYPHLAALEYTGDRMLSLDFGARHYLLEGRGLDELARRIQEGAVLAIQEYAPSLWPQPAADALVSHIRLLAPTA